MLFGSFAQAQRTRGKSIGPQNEKENYIDYVKEDSIDFSYRNENLLRVIVDTLPSFSKDDLNAFRDIKLVSYYYDSLRILKKIWFRNGQEGNYNFYFDDLSLKKIRARRYSPSMNVLYLCYKLQRVIFPQM